MENLKPINDLTFQLPAETLVQRVQDAHEHSLSLISDLSDEQMVGPYLETVNPSRWEIGHVSFFYERFILRLLDNIEPIMPDVDEFYDSFEIEHKLRWGDHLPSHEKTMEYLHDVFNRTIDRLSSHEPTPQETYLYTLAILHETMHDEALTWTRQTRQYPIPQFRKTSSTQKSKDNISLDVVGLPHHQHSDIPLGGIPQENGVRDIAIPGGSFLLGPQPDTPFIFDNEKWAHPLESEPFQIARTAVTNSEFISFVEDQGYTRPELWSFGGKQWMDKANVTHPIYWKKEEGQWLQRHFNQWFPLKENNPIVHVCWYEAEAYCHWAGRRLPTELEWEIAASGQPTSDGQSLSDRKRTYPWGDIAPTSAHANLDFNHLGCVDVNAFPEGDSAFGCRQMIGNVWEWTSSPFYPYPGFIIDFPYKEYSAPWFGYPKVLRGGTWATRSLLIRNTYRNFFLPDRRDVFAGFRTCAK